jgi:2-polyprenyl-3-methyl-5-hydroxy-6-metoxy-1,4-benzoquinol methylase
MNPNEEVMKYLQSEYQGVLSHEEISDHYERYVNFIQARELIARFQLFPILPRNLLDIGCGYGSFVIEARKIGIDAQGIDSSRFEIDFARNRLLSSLPQKIDASEVFIFGDGTTLTFPEDGYEVITAWNVLEHVSDRDAFLKQVFRSLRPGGSFHFICPNYASWRREAHYRVVWAPYLSKKLAHRYLQARSRNPFFLDNFIFPVYKRSLIRELKDLGFSVTPPQHRLRKLENPSLIYSRYLRLGVVVCKRLGLLVLVRTILVFWTRNPFTRGIDLVAQK